MKKIYFILALFCVSALSAQNPTFQWAKSVGSTNIDIANAVCTDASGNIYTTGKFTGTVDFDSGSGVVNLSSASSTSPDAFITKSDSNGNLIWAKKIGGTSDDIGNAIKTDANGNVFVVGNFAYVCDFDPSTSGTYSLGQTYLTNQSFILKLDTNGNFVWANIVEATNPTPQYTTSSTTNAGRQLAIDSSGDVIVTGNFKGSTVFGGTTTLNGIVNDIYILKYTNAGVFSWVKQIGGTQADFPGGLDTDTAGNIYILGYFNSNGIDVDPGAGTVIFAAAGGNATNDTFLLKLDSSGNYVWSKKTSEGNSKDEFGRDLKVMGTDVYVAGNFSTNTDFDPSTTATNYINTTGSSDNFISKYDTSGNYYWTKTFGGTGSDFISSIAFDSQNNLYATGSFNTTVDFNPSSTADYTVPSFAANDDVYILKWTANGDFTWVQQLGGSNGAEVGNAITVDGSNNVIVVGTLAASGNYQPFGSTILATNGSNDIFTVKMQSGTSALAVQDFDSKSFQLYPNPSNGIYNLNSETDGAYSIVNNLGHVLQKGKIESGSNTIDIQNKPNGLYFIQFNNGKALKIIKQ